MRAQAFARAALLTVAGASLAFGLQLEHVLQGNHEIINGVEAVWQLPATQAKGVLFLAHGCQHSATDFWPYSPSCTQCIGLPEEQRIVHEAISAKWAVISLSSFDRQWLRCWEFQSDGERAANALRIFRETHQLSHLPLAALGASSGGAFVLMLPKLLQVHAVVSQVMAIPPQHLVAESEAYPPTLFVHMARDRRTEANVHKCVRRLRETGSIADQITAKPLAIDAGFFSRRVPGLAEPLSASLRAVLASAGLLDPVSSQLLEDPRRSGWRDAVRAAPAVASALPGAGPTVPDSLVADESAISEELNVAWAMHEIVADQMPAVMQWIDSAINPNRTKQVATLLGELVSRRELRE